MLSKTGTCSSCGYEKIHCICHNQSQAGTIYARNTSGETGKYQHFENYSNNPDDYSETARIYRHSNEQKFMEEFYPQENEELSTYISRTATATNKLIEHSMHKHIYGGRKPWPSHTSTRYCPVCTLCQFVNNLTDIILAFSEQVDISKFRFNIIKDVDPLKWVISFKEPTSSK